MKKVKEENISVVLASTIFDNKSAVNKKNATTIVAEIYHENYYG